MSAREIVTKFRFRHVWIGLAELEAIVCYREKSFPFNSIERSQEKMNWTQLSRKFCLCSSDTLVGFGGTLSFVDEPNCVIDVRPFGFLQT